MSKHTPGPWKVCAHVPKGKDRRNFYTVEVVDGPWAGSQVCSLISEVSVSMDKSNAALIAAAPELYAALLTISRLDTEGGYGAIAREALKKMDATQEVKP